MQTPENCQRRQQAHHEACRRRIGGLLKGDPVGSARLAAADERINRALADAVERHATKGPGVRGILKRASVVGRPESEPQQKFALDTEQDPIPDEHMCGQLQYSLYVTCDAAQNWEEELASNERDRVPMRVARLHQERTYHGNRDW